MIGKPKYKEGDVVTFQLGSLKKTGTIEIIDAFGTFEDNSDVSYDIMVTEENIFYKHIREDFIIK